MSFEKNFVLKEFIDCFHESPTDYFESPGRIELLGNHTDHNHGVVLVSSVNLAITCAASKRKDNIIHVNSIGFRPMTIDINDIEKKEKEFGTSLALIKGVLYKMKNLGYKIGGFNATLTSTVPNGAGVSSSAAFEVLISKILSYYYNDDKILPFELAQISQYSESVYFNKPCGLLDQSGISLGGINYIDFKDINNPVIDNIKVEIPGYQFIIINTGDDHTKLTPYYKAIKDDMANVSKMFNASYLRDLDMNQVLSQKDKIIKELGENAYLRAKHFYEENIRVMEAYKALGNHDFEIFLQKLDESGTSSYYQLKNCYCESEDEKLAKALRFVKTVDKECYSRVHGGGFAGTMLMIVKKENLEKDLKELYNYFGEKNVMLVSLNPLGTTHLD